MLFRAHFWFFILGPLLAELGASYGVQGILWDSVSARNVGTTGLPTWRSSSIAQSFSKIQEGWELVCCIAAGWYLCQGCEYRSVFMN